MAQDLATHVDELSRLRAVAETYRDPRLYQVLADWYQEIGFEANAASCAQRALYYSQEETDVAKKFA